MHNEMMTYDTYILQANNDSRKVFLMPHSMLRQKLTFLGEIENTEKMW